MSRGKELRKPKAKRLPTAQMVDNDKARIKDRPVEALDSALNPVPRGAPAEKVSGKHRQNLQK